MTSALTVRHLSVSFSGDDGQIPAVQDISFQVASGRTLCIVGESGSGKTVTALATMGLCDTRTSQVQAETLLLGDRDLQRLSPQVRGDRIAMVFQDPMTALNPYLRLGEQLAEVLTEHRGMTQRQALDQSEAMLRRVGIAAPAERLRAFPHELSGGMRQRALIAMALLCHPEVLLADEPTTALDVTVQAQVLSLLKDLQTDMGMALVLVTHDLGVVAHMADEVLVMYAGLGMEQAPVQALFDGPRHPYTVLLMASRPSQARRGEKLHAIEGMPPSPSQRPTGCVFAPRCPLAEARCHAERPQLIEIAQNHSVACHRRAEVAQWAADA